MIIIAQIVWVVLTAVIILVDRNLMEQREDPNNPDLTDRGITSYLLFTLLFGGFVIPFYMWNSRKSGAAVAAGVGLMVACALVAGFVLKSVATI